MLSSLLGVASLVLGVVEWLDWPSLLAPSSILAGRAIALGALVFRGLRFHTWRPHLPSLAVSFLSGCAAPVAALVVFYPLVTGGTEPLAGFVPLGGVAMAWVILAGIRQGLERAEPTGAVVGAQPAAVAEEG